MITREDDVDIHALRRQGWTITAIARPGRLDPPHPSPHAAALNPSMARHPRHEWADQLAITGHFR